MMTDEETIALARIQSALFKEFGDRTGHPNCRTLMCCCGLASQLFHMAARLSDEGVIDALLTNVPLILSEVCLDLYRDRPEVKQEAFELALKTLNMTLEGQGIVYPEGVRDSIIHSAPRTAQ